MGEYSEAGKSALNILFPESDNFRVIRGGFCQPCDQRGCQPEIFRTTHINGGGQHPNSGLQPHSAMYTYGMFRRSGFLIGSFPAGV